jgi:hypothetical protein
MYREKKAVNAGTGVRRYARRLRLSLAACVGASLRLPGVVCECCHETLQSGVCSLDCKCSVSAANSPVRLRENSVRLVDVDVLPKLA